MAASVAVRIRSRRKRNAADIIDIRDLLPKTRAKRPRRGRVTTGRKKRTTYKTGGGYPSYLFPQDYDPILDVVQAVIEYTELNIREIVRASGVAKSTIINYKNKYVRRPSHTTVAAVLRACRATEYYKVGEKIFVVMGKLDG